MHNRPTDIELPTGWTWERVETERAKWDISETMIPVAVVPGACVAWCTINSVRVAKYRAELDARAVYARKVMAAFRANDMEACAKAQADMRARFPT